MKSVNKTKKQLIDELEVMQERVLELEALEIGLNAARQELHKRIGGCFQQMQHMDEAIYAYF